MGIEQIVTCPKFAAALHQIKRPQPAQGPVETGLIGVDDAGLRMRWIAESLAEQVFGRRSIAQRRQQEVDGDTGGIDDPVEVTPTALDSNICLINPPGFCWSA